VERLGAPAPDGTDLGGSVRLLPTGAGDFVLEPFVTGKNGSRGFLLPVPGRAPGGTVFAEALAQGTCAEWEALASASPSGTPGAVVRPELLLTPWSERFRRMRVEAAALAGPTAYVVGEAGGNGPVRACADLPTAAARLLEPAPGTAPWVAEVQPVPPWRVGGGLKVWSTPGGDLLLRAETEGPPEEITRWTPALAVSSPNLMWSVVEGRCAEWVEGSGRQANPGRVVARFTPPVEEPGRQTFSLVIARRWQEWWRPSRPLTLLAFVNGGGGLVACADVPAGPGLAAAG
jgi:hypothetical protein